MKNKILCVIILCLLVIVGFLMAFILTGRNCETEDGYTYSRTSMTDSTSDNNLIWSEDLSWMLFVNSHEDIELLRESLYSNDSELLDALESIDVMNRGRTRDDVIHFLNILDSVYIPEDPSWDNLIYNSFVGSLIFSYLIDLEWIYSVSIFSEEHSFRDFKMLLEDEEIPFSDVTNYFPSLVQQGIQIYLVEEERHQSRDDFMIFGLNINGFHAYVSFSYFPNEGTVFEILNSLEFARGVL